MLQMMWCPYTDKSGWFSQNVQKVHYYSIFQNNVCSRSDEITKQFAAACRNVFL